MKQPILNKEEYTKILSLAVIPFSKFFGIKEENPKIARKVLVGLELRDLYQLREENLEKFMSIEDIGIKTSTLRRYYSDKYDVFNERINCLRHKLDRVENIVVFTSYLNEYYGDVKK